MLSPDQFVPESKALLQEIAKRIKEGPFGSFSPSIYDTSWLARVRQPDNQSQWLFPECFAYLLETQSQEGGRTVHLTEVDRILNTMAALVTLREHQDGHDTAVSGLGERIAKAQRMLQVWLREWDVASPVHIGTEILVPALLEVLEQDGTVKFDFPGRERLMAWNQKKFRKFRPEMLYAPQQTTLVFSLEALVGKIDFDRVSHHIDQRGSMMGSPAATAAYLMNCSVWNDKAEAYLRTVVREGSGNGGGGVPCVFPTWYSEVVFSAWLTDVFGREQVTAALLKANSSAAILEMPENVEIRNFLQSLYDANGGVIGFDSGMDEDADDAAKLILSLSLLGSPPSPERMIQEFESAESFRTYRRESTTSFSANGNVLDALVHTSTPARYSGQIVKVARFLCREFESGAINDKWNLSETYCLLSATWAFVKLLQLWGDDKLGDDFPQDLVSEQIPLVLVRVCMQLMQTQQRDGCWVLHGASHETTAYGVLILKALVSLPWLVQFRPRIEKAIQRGCDYLSLNKSRWDDLDHIWVAKTTYAVPTMSRSYVIAALTAGSSHEWTEKVQNLVALPHDRLRHMAKFFSGLPMFGQDELWVLEGDLLLGWFYQARLTRAAADIFPQRAKETGGKYLEYIPFTWIATNRRQGSPLSYKAIYDMMLVSLYTYQLDEYMEACFDSRTGLEGDEARKMLKELCKFSNVRQERDGDEGRSEETNGDSVYAMPSQSQEVGEVLHRLTSYLLEHPVVAQSPAHVRRHLHSQLASGMAAHIDHEEDSRHAAAAFESARHPTYYAWVQEVGAKKIEAPWVFLVFCCLAASSSPGEPFFVGARQNYLANALSQHLAAYCRQYNDYGSVVRDRDDGNLNSLDFPEFSGSGSDVQSLQPNPVATNGGGMAAAAVSRDNDAKKKADLLSIADYERECVDHVMGKLCEEMRRGGRKGDGKIKALNVYVDTGELYRQIYVVRDISNQKMR
ncbi:Copalyl diphosphate synthase [Apiospora rasikravindrae]|uniref:Copalyl diphosphate synthase n=1 Tax=Apiospora rasikravindrae TaxID=990691 RepID=A0ABR1SVZ7_9PEZI